MLTSPPHSLHVHARNQCQEKVSPSHHPCLSLLIVMGLLTFSLYNFGKRALIPPSYSLSFDWEKGGWDIPGVNMWKLDEAEYLQAVNGHWPQADIHTIREIKYLGTIFRAIDGFFWEVKSLDYADEPNVRVRVIDRLFRYRFHMAGAMQALNI